MWERTRGRLATMERLVWVERTGRKFEIRGRIHGAGGAG